MTNKYFAHCGCCNIDFDTHEKATIHFQSDEHKRKASELLGRIRETQKGYTRDE